MERRDVLRVGAIVGVAALFGWRATPTRVSENTSSAGDLVPSRRAAPAGRRPARSARPGAGEEARGPGQQGPETEPPSQDAPAADEDTDADDLTDDDGSGSESAEPDEPPPDPGATVEVICREALGLVAAAADTRSHRLTRVTLHHSAVELGSNRHAPARLRGHQRFHQDQGWPDIAYHIGVDASGNVYELRNPSRPGDTFTDYDPVDHYLILCEGNYDVERPTDAMLDAVARIIADASHRYGIDPNSLTGHRDHAGTSCPGEHLYPEIPALTQEARRYASTTVQRTAVCEEVGRDRIAAIEAA